MRGRSERALSLALRSDGPLQHASTAAHTTEQAGASGGGRRGWPGSGDKLDFAGKVPRAAGPWDLGARASPLGRYLARGPKCSLSSSSSPPSHRRLFSPPSSFPRPPPHPSLSPDSPRGLPGPADAAPLASALPPRPRLFLRPPSLSSPPSLPPPDPTASSPPLSPSARPLPFGRLPARRGLPLLSTTTPPNEPSGSSSNSWHEMSPVVEEDTRPTPPSIASFSTFEREKSIRACTLPRVRSPRLYPSHSRPLSKGSRPYDDSESLSSRQTPAPSFFDPNYDTEITWIGTSLHNLPSRPLVLPTPA